MGKGVVSVQIFRTPTPAHARADATPSSRRGGPSCTDGSVIGQRVEYHIAVRSVGNPIEYVIAVAPLGSARLGHLPEPLLGGSEEADVPCLHAANDLRRMGSRRTGTRGMSSSAFFGTGPRSAGAHCTSNQDTQDVTGGPRDRGSVAASMKHPTGRGPDERLPGVHAGGRAMDVSGLVRTPSCTAPRP